MAVNWSWQTLKAYDNAAREGSSLLSVVRYVNIEDQSYQVFNVTDQSNQALHQAFDLTAKKCTGKFMRCIYMYIFKGATLIYRCNAILCRV